MSDKENAKQGKSGEELAIANRVAQEKKNLGENVVGSPVDGSDTGSVPQGPWGWLNDTPTPGVQSEPSQSTDNSGGGDQAGQPTESAPAVQSEPSQSRDNSGGGDQDGQATK